MTRRTGDSADLPADGDLERRKARKIEGCGPRLDPRGDVVRSGCGVSQRLMTAPSLTSVLSRPCARAFGETQRAAARAGGSARSCRCCPLRPAGAGCGCGLGAGSGSGRVGCVLPTAGPVRATSLVAGPTSLAVASARRRPALAARACCAHGRAASGCRRSHPVALPRNRIRRAGRAPRAAHSRCCPELRGSQAEGSAARLAAGDSAVVAPPGGTAAAVPVAGSPVVVPAGAGAAVE